MLECLEINLSAILCVQEGSAEGTAVEMGSSALLRLSGGETGESLKTRVGGVGVINGLLFNDFNVDHRLETQDEAEIMKTDRTLSTHTHAHTHWSSLESSVAAL